MRDIPGVRRTLTKKQHGDFAINDGFRKFFTRRAREWSLSDVGSGSRKRERGQGGSEERNEDDDKEENEEGEGYEERSYMDESVEEDASENLHGSRKRQKMTFSAEGGRGYGAVEGTMTAQPNSSLLVNLEVGSSLGRGVSLKIQASPSTSSRSQ
jgi:hypothetical protein